MGDIFTQCSMFANTVIFQSTTNLHHDDLQMGGGSDNSFAKAPA